jgi:hypothetical protein
MLKHGKREDFLDLAKTPAYGIMAKMLMGNAKKFRKRKKGDAKLLLVTYMFDLVEICFFYAAVEESGVGKGHRDFL